MAVTGGEGGFDGGLGFVVGNLEDAEAEDRHLDAVVWVTLSMGSLSGCIGLSVGLGVCGFVVLVADGFKPRGALPVVVFDQGHGTSCCLS
ncbi:hypothetical protein HNP00_001789 [Arthrobacter sp. AZCC_0090]|nr:hypothetical protein [Arthrobacter sp. AZCC_0090]MBB6404476.1 hypothetical protein [Arthrobacter sp. AZCC_0090]